MVSRELIIVTLLSKRIVHASELVAIQLAGFLVSTVAIVSWLLVITVGLVNVET